MRSRPRACIGLWVLLGTSWAAGLQRSDIRATIDAYISTHQRAIVSELIDLVSIPNVGSDTENIRRNVVQLRETLRRRGFSADILETDGNPLVWGEMKEIGRAHV